MSCLEIILKSRNKSHKLANNKFLLGGRSPQLDLNGDIDLGEVVQDKRWANIPPQMFQTKYPALFASVDWARVKDEDDEYQPWINGTVEDRSFPLTADQSGIIFCKIKNRYMTQSDFNEVLTDG